MSTTHIPGQLIEDASISSAKIALLAIITALLADGAVTPVKIATGAVQPAKLAQMITLAGSGTITLDASAGARFKTTLTASSTMAAFSAPADGNTLILAVTQGGAGSYTLAFNANVRYTATVPSITLSTAVGKTDYIGFYYNAVDAKWDIIAFTPAA
jgi:hypothetical protein